ncbi:carbohydrate kinase [Paenibacillus sp. sgz500958]|uniref:carbohydrate kinase family protein n=1 Tax=Paenibacillus sp. sgz500958 TaxID=3242475 RepID=UPI0036D42A56
MAYDVVALGELLIDFTPGGLSPSGNPLFERNAGGAPVNVLAALSRLGKRTAFIGKVGNDPFGHYLQDTLRVEGIDDSGLLFTDRAHTTMAFVHLDAQGERSFHFCRQPGADEELKYSEIETFLLDRTEIFHFGSISMSSESSHEATLKAALMAISKGAVITYDPNWRPALWRDEEHARLTMEEGMKLANVIKLSEEELVFLSQKNSLEAGVKVLMERFPAKLMLVTRGEEGTYYSTRTLSGNVPSYPVKPVDTTGAGDGFMGAFIYQLLEAGKPAVEWTKEELETALSFANAAGALATTRKGAIASLATLEEILLLTGK